MIETSFAPDRAVIRRIGRWAGGAALAASLAFIGERLWSLDWTSLQIQPSWAFAGALAGAPLLFAAADALLRRGWAATADPDRTCPHNELSRIYARGVLMKYLPGSVFQYASRQINGARAGLAHRRLAKASATEIALHVVSSLFIAAVCLAFERAGVIALAAATIVVIAAMAIRRPLTVAVAFQILAFGLFAAAAILIGAATLPAGASLTHFAAIFLLAWLAGFVAPVAPGGIGVREAALLALAGGALPDAALMAATLALRAASIVGDLGYGLGILLLRPTQQPIPPRSP